MLKFAVSRDSDYNEKRKKERRSSNGTEETCSVCRDRRRSLSQGRRSSSRPRTSEKTNNLEDILRESSPKNQMNIKAKIKYTFEPDDEKEIRVEKGEVVLIKYRQGDLVFVQVKTNRGGLVPLRYCRALLSPVTSPVHNPDDKKLSKSPSSGDAIMPLTPPSVNKKDNNTNASQRGKTPIACSPVPSDANEDQEEEAAAGNRALTDKTDHNQNLMVQSLTVPAPSFSKDLARNSICGSIDSDYGTIESDCDSLDHISDISSSALNSAEETFSSASSDSGIEEQLQKAIFVKAPAITVYRAPSTAHIKEVPTLSLRSTKRTQEKGSPTQRCRRSAAGPGSNGKQMRVPSQAHVVLYPFRSTRKCELCVDAEEKVQVLRCDYSRQWLYVRKASGEEGLVPRCYTAPEKNGHLRKKINSRGSLYPSSAKDGLDPRGFEVTELTTKVSTTHRHTARESREISIEVGDVVYIRRDDLEFKPCWIMAYSAETHRIGVVPTAFLTQRRMEDLV